MAQRKFIITLIQWWDEVNMRYGRDYLMDVIKGAEGGRRYKRVENLETGEFYLFRNKKMNIIKIIGNSPLVGVAKLPDNQTWDLDLRAKQIIELALGCFGIEDVEMSEDAQKKTDRVISNYEINYPRKFKIWQENRSSE